MNDFRQEADTLNVILAIQSDEDQEGTCKERYRAKFTLGVAYLHTREYAKAEELFTELKQDPSENGYRFECLVNLGIAAVMQEKYDAGQELLKEALSSRPLNRSALFYVGYLEAKKAKRTSSMNGIRTAISAYQKCLIFHPEFLPAALNLSKLFRRIKQYHSAAEALLSMIKIYPKHLSLHYQLALTHLNANSPSQAISLLKEVLKDFKEMEIATAAAHIYDEF